MISDLYAKLEALDEKLNELINIVQDKKDALVHRNLDALDSCIKREENILLLINRIERERLDIIKQISGIEKIPANFQVDLFYQELFASIPERVAESIQQLRESIKSKAKTISDINKNNIALVETSRDFIRMLFQNLKGEKRSLVVNKKV